MKAIIARKKKPSTNHSKNSVTSQAEKVTKLINDYLEKPLLSQSDNPLDFWREYTNGDRLQQALSKVAKRYLTPPCSTVDVERLFSDAGDILCENRMSLKAPKVEKILYMHQNMKHCKYDY